MGRQHQGMDRPGVRQVAEGSGEQGKIEKTSCKLICGAPTTLAVKVLMMMMMMINVWIVFNHFVYLEKGLLVLNSCWTAGYDFCSSS